MALLSPATAVLAQEAAGQTGEAWDLGSQRNGRRYPTTLAASNLCRGQRDFAIELQGSIARMLRFEGAPRIDDVPRGESRSIDVVLDLTAVPPGRYDDGVITIRCLDCGVRCRPDRTVLEVRLEVVDGEPGTATGSTEPVADEGVRQLFEDLDEIADEPDEGSLYGDDGGDRPDLEAGEAPENDDAPFADLDDLGSGPDDGGLYGDDPEGEGVSLYTAEELEALLAEIGTGDPEEVDGGSYGDGGAPLFGNRVVIQETDAQGYATTTVTDRYGTVLLGLAEADGTKEPGQVYFERVLAQNELDRWEDLPDWVKAKFAASERHIVDTARQAELRHELELQAAREDAEHEAFLAALQEKTDRELAAIDAEQAEADRREAIRLQRAAREREIAALEEQAESFRRALATAQWEGDEAEVQRIERAWDALHAHSMTVLLPTAEELARMEEQQDARTRLAAEVVDYASAVVDEGLPAEVAAQQAKEKFTNVLRWVSVSAEMSHLNNATTRSEDRQLAFAEAKIDYLERRLDDPETTATEREILREMLEVADVAAAGAREHLESAERLTEAGLAIDVALMVTGGKLATLAKRGVVYGAEKVFATQTAERVVYTTTEAGLTELAGRGSAQVVTNTTRAASAATANPVATAATEAVEAAATSPGRPASIREVLERLRLVNPKFRTDPGARANCAFCTEATADVLRGVTPSAVPTRAATAAEYKLQSELGTASLPLEGPVKNWLQVGSRRTIEELFGALPPGSHGRVWGVRAGRSGHVFNVWKAPDGVVWFIDGQTGRIARFSGQGYTKLKLLLTDF